MSLTKEPAGIKPGNVDEVVRLVEEPKANDPFTDDGVSTQRKSNIFRENLFQRVDAAGTDESRDVNKDMSHWEAVTPFGHAKWTFSKGPLLTSGFPSPGDLFLNIDKQAEESRRRESSALFSSPRASTPPGAAPKIGSSAQEPPSNPFAPTKTSPPSLSTGILSTPTKLTNFGVELGASQNSKQAFKFELPDGLKQSTTEAQLRVKREFSSASREQLPLFSSSLFSQIDPLSSSTSTLDPVSALNPSVRTERSPQIPPKTPAASGSTPSPPLKSGNPFGSPLLHAVDVSQQKQQKSFGVEIPDQRGKL